MNTIHRFGWTRDIPDVRDYRVGRELRLQVPSRLPPSVDLRSGLGAPYDQGDLGSCTANAIAAALQFDRRQQKLPDFVPSRLFVYYNERALEGTIKSDAGAQIRDGIKSVAAQGAPPETLWPYAIARFTRKPTKKAYTEGARHLAGQYARVPRELDAMLGVLASGFPFVFGFTCYESLESSEVQRTGILPMPAKGERVIGGHAVLCVGYDGSTKRFLVRNSWGTGWGQNGHFTMPFDYLLSSSLAADFWVIRATS